MLEGLLDNTDSAKTSDDDGLIDDASLDVFAAWYGMGGAQRGMSVQEIEGMSAARLQDFNTILRFMLIERKAKEFKKGYGGFE